MGNEYEKASHVHMKPDNNFQKLIEIFRNGGTGPLFIKLLNMLKLRFVPYEQIFTKCLTIN